MFSPLMVMSHLA